MFGDYFNGLLQSGVSFNWILFLCVTVVILGAKIYFFGHSRSKRFSFSRFVYRLTRKVVKDGSKRYARSKLREDQELKDMEKIRGEINRR